MAIQMVTFNSTWEEQIKMIKQRIDALKSLDHPSIAKYIEVYIENNSEHHVGPVSPENGSWEDIIQC